MHASRDQTADTVLELMKLHIVSSLIICPKTETPFLFPSSSLCLYGQGLLVYCFIKKNPESSYFLNHYKIYNPMATCHKTLNFGSMANILVKLLKTMHVKHVTSLGWPSDLYVGEILHTLQNICLQKVNSQFKRVSKRTFSPRILRQFLFLNELLKFISKFYI